VIGAYLAAYIAARWFVARQGLVVGILTAANAPASSSSCRAWRALVNYAGWRAMSVCPGHRRFGRFAPLFDAGHCAIGRRMSGSAPMATRTGLR